MRPFTFEEISPAELDAFSATHPQGNFQQSSGTGVRRAKAGIDVSYYGVREAGTLVAATQLEVHPARFAAFAQIHDGPLMDFADAELVTFFCTELAGAARARGAEQLFMTPEVPYAVRSSNGELLPAPDSTEPWPSDVPQDAPTGTADSLIRNITDAGFTHAGLTLGYSDIPRWRYVKDLRQITDEKALLASYQKNTKRNVRIAHESGVYVERIDRDRLGLFHDICELSCEKQGFENMSVAYYESLYDALGDDVNFMIAYIDTRAYLASWEEKRDGFAKDVARFEKLLETSPSPEKVEKKLRDVQGKYEASLKRIEGARAFLDADGEKIPAAAAAFSWHPRECVYLFSGSNPTYAKFYAATAIQHHMMLECITRGVQRYNFYGINGVFDDPDDPGRGLLEFKQGFGGYVEEMLGEFSMVLRPGAHAVKNLARKLLGHS